MVFHQLLPGQKGSAGWIRMKTFENTMLLASNQIPGSMSVTPLSCCHCSSKTGNDTDSIEVSGCCLEVLLVGGGVPRPSPTAHKLPWGESQETFRISCHPQALLRVHLCSQIMFCSTWIYIANFSRIIIIL